MNTTKTIPSLNGIRALCIILVIGSHANRAANFPLQIEHTWNYFFNGSLGVNIFFVLSGFLITFLLLKEEKEKKYISLTNFYVRRILRIFPVYYLLLTVYAFLQFAGIVHIPLAHWISSVTYTKNYGHGSWIDGHLWSLAVEEQFYLIWPIIFKYLPQKNRIQFAVFVICLCPLMRVVAYKYLNNESTNLPLFSNMSFFTNMDSLMTGCLAAIYLPQLTRILNKFNQTKIRLSALLIIFTIWYLQLNFIAGLFTLPLGRTLTNVSAVILIISFGFFQHGPGFRFLNLKALNYLGVLSYSIYIWQQMFFANELGNFSKLPFNYLFIFLTAIASYHLVEKPVLKLKNRFNAKKIRRIAIPRIKRLNSENTLIVEE